jgi:hypothetical protein
MPGWVRCWGFKLTLRKPAPGTGLFAQDLAIVPGICNEHVILADAIELFERASSETYNYPPSIPKIYGQVSMWIFQQRELLWLGGASGRVVVNSSHRAVFTIDGKPVVGAPILDGIEQQDEDGTIEAFFSTTYLQLFFVISIKAKPVAVMFVTDPPQIFADDVNDSVMDRALYLRIAAEQEQIISEFLKQQPSYELLEEMRRICSDRRNEVFSELALHSVDPERREECKKAMMRRGFWHVVGGDLESVKKFTLLSEIVAYGASESELELVKDKMAWSLCVLEDCIREAGFPKSQIDTEDLTVFV